MKNENDIPAFPLIDEIGNYIQEGMTLRDYFANSAMISVVRKYKGTNSDLYDFDSEDSESIAFYSYQLADAMLKQREL